MHWSLRLAQAALILLLLSGCESPSATSAAQDSAAAADAYVGANVCAGCHASQADLWQGSHHDLAMQIATPTTVLGDFAGSSFEHNGVTTRFLRRAEQLVISTDGPDGLLADFPVRYTFGVYPLQQYIVELPVGETSKLQAFGVAWDSRAAAVGGQRWFHVYGDELIDHTDVLHWTNRSQNWETMCADCHSTNLTSKYDLASDRFTTDWAELNVACEACHGPGSRHVQWANTGVAGDGAAANGLTVQLTERAGVDWLPNEQSATAMRSEPNSQRAEITACAGCHSRRARIAEGNHPAAAFLDIYSPALIDEPLYHADGQIRDEVYVYGSFLQSKMYVAGVTCSDCHEPHSLQLRAPAAEVCLQCHAPAAFAAPAHQLHAGDDVTCIDCHMPATTYMQVDDRNDHSFRIPRPELTERFGVPNACSACHADKSPAWLQAAIGSSAAAGASPVAKPGGAHWSEVLANAGGADQAAFAALLTIAADQSVPAIIRATAIARMRFDNSPDGIEVLAKLAAENEPLIRMAVAQAMQSSHPAVALAIGADLLNDPVRAVRLDAASALLAADPALLPAGVNRQLQLAIDEYIAAQLVSNERSAAHVNIGNVQRLQRRPELAEASYLTAIELSPQFVPAYVNLADLYRGWEREADAERILRAGLVQSPEQSSLQHALGLSLVRQQRVAEGLPALQSAALAADATPRYALVYAVALNSVGQRSAALNFLAAAMQRFPADAQLRNAYAEFAAAR